MLTGRVGPARRKSRALSDRNRQSHRQRVEGHGVPLVEVGDGSAPLLGLVGPDHPRDADRNGADSCSGPRSLGRLTASEFAGSTAARVSTWLGIDDEADESDLVPWPLQGAFLIPLVTPVVLI